MGGAVPRGVDGLLGLMKDQEAKRAPTLARRSARLVRPLGGR